MGFQVSTGFLWNSRPGGLRFPQISRTAGCLCLHSLTGLPCSKDLPWELPGTFSEQFLGLSHRLAWHLLLGSAFLGSLGVRGGGELGHLA